jgi:signal transduction histidine kinase
LTRFNSLSVRLIAAAAIWSVVALAAAGLILTSLYRQTVERAFDERLGVYLQTLIGNLASQGPNAPSDPGNLGEQRFELVYSGWYWQVRQPNNGPVLLTSTSLVSDTLDASKAFDTHNVNGITSGAMVGPENQSLRFIDRTIILPSASFDVLIAGDAGDLQNQIAAFRNSVIITMAAFGIGLIAAILIQIRWGLRPLDRVRLGLAALRSGRETRIEGPFPTEIEPLTRELNALLESNQQIIERARTQVGNLAHALKTPLSVITNEARSNRSPFADKIAEQAELMRTQVNSYLDRARIAARSTVIGAITEVEPVVARLARAMRRIHDDKGLSIIESVPAGARFKGEQQDLEEILGNLVDNACKWARSKVAILVDYTPAPDQLSDAKLVFRIDDDGPGLTEEQRAEATRRGKRLDESKPGSGLGLSIVTDLVALYGGKFRLARSPDGGLRAEIELPGA